MLIEAVTDYAIYIARSRWNHYELESRAKRFKGYEEAEILG